MHILLSPIRLLLRRHLVHAGTLAAVASLVVSTSGCRGDARPKADGQAAAHRVSAPRRWRSVAFDTVWIAGGSAEDSVLAYPAMLVATDSLVVVADIAHRRITALSARTGRPVWRAGRRGKGPGDFQKPLSLGLAPNNDVVVADERLPRLTVFTTSGRIRRIITLSRSLSNSVCALNDGTYLLSEGTDEGILFRVDSSGVATADTLPWADARTLRPLALQARLHRDPSTGRCLITLSLGRGFALWDPAGPPMVGSYIEQFDVPPILRRESRRPGEVTVDERLPLQASDAGIDAAFDGDRVRILFSGTTDSAGRIIDDYDQATLRYRESIVLPVRAQRMAITPSGLLLLLAERDGYPMVMALRERRSASR